MTHELLILTGASGAGKTTIANVLACVDNFRQVVTYTTRQPRPGEVHGIQYYFITVAKFRKMKAQQQFIETAQVYGNFYGTTYEAIKNTTNSRLILVTDIQGTRSVDLEASARNIKLCVVFLTVPESILRERLYTRGTESQEDLQCRLQTAAHEATQISELYHCIPNTTIKETCTKIKQLLNTREYNT